MRHALVSILALGLVVVGSQCGGQTVGGSGSDASTDSAGGGGDAGGVTHDSGGGDGSGGGCNCEQGRICCGGQCVNPDNDPKNCGNCGIVCGGTTPYCDGSCQRTPCAQGGPTCIGAQFCCGSSCCDSGQLCCKEEGPIGGGPPSCFTPTSQQPTCPQGCAPQCKSDRNVKRDIEPVDEQEVLRGVASMPISTWSYSSDPNATRHLGPMAQDFHAAFGLGASDRSYDPIDAHGVAFAAIKALAERVDKLERENEELRASCSSSARCTGGDSNPHVFRRRNLNPLRLPISPPVRGLTAR